MEIVSKLRKEAKEAQDRAPFDSNKVYETLINPEGGNKKILNEFAELAAAVYADSDAGDIVQIFRNDFKYWEKKHFELLDTRVRSSIRDLLVQKGGVPLASGRNVRISTGFADYLEKFRAEQDRYLADLRRRLPVPDTRNV